MHGNEEKNLDDSLFLQIVVYFFLWICSMCFFQENKHSLILMGMGHMPLYMHLNK
jgi:hypothetical protein